MITTTIHERRPFNLRYIVAEGKGIHGDDMRATHRTAACNYWYIMRQAGSDQFGPTPDFASRRDLFDHGRCAPKDAFSNEYAGILPWIAADAAASVNRPDQPIAMHAVGTLPRDGDRGSWRSLVETFGEDHLASKGMIADWAIHCERDGADGFEIVPHVHWLLSARVFRRGGRHGLFQKPWLSTKSQVDALANIWFELTGLYPADYRKPAI